MTGERRRHGRLCVNRPLQLNLLLHPAILSGSSCDDFEATTKLNAIFDDITISAKERNCLLLCSTPVCALLDEWYLEDI
jgi:hypothetical protein